MTKNDINPLPAYFDRYINLVEAIPLAAAFSESEREIERLDINLLRRLDQKRPAPDKWTIQEIFQHLIDWERILGCRALLFARLDGAVAQSIDEKILAANMRANLRPLEELINELRIVRAATSSLFAGFDKATLLKTGINWQSEMSVLAMGLTIIGHQKHHLKILAESYYPLLEN